MRVLFILQKDPSVTSSPRSVIFQSHVETADTIRGRKKNVKTFLHTPRTSEAAPRPLAAPKKTPAVFLGQML